MHRRALLMGASAALAAPAIARAAADRVLRIVPQTNLVSIDPIWTISTIGRNHGYLVYDTLFGLTLDLQPTPQMAAGIVEEDDGRSVTIHLRDGLTFHDGERIRASDCVASILRWGKRNPFGQRLASVTDELTFLNDSRLRFRLKRRFPLLPRALANAGQPAYIMPERIAATDAFKQINDPTGSGPFRFKRDEFISGQMVVYERNPAYVPIESGQLSLTSGPKRVFFDRVQWHVIADGSTAASALQKGEIDWYEQPTPEQVTFLRRTPSVAVEKTSPFPACCFMRFNFLHPPFNNKAARRSILPAIEQSDFMTAVNGTENGAWQEGGIFTPGSIMATAAGLEPLQGPRSIQTAATLLKQSGYNNEPMRLIGPTDLMVPTALTQVGADVFRRMGFNVELALSDQGTVQQRRASREAVERGGWSVFMTNFSGVDFLDPGSHPVLAGNGTGPGSYSGWPTIPRLEVLRDAYFEAGDEAARKAVCEDLQRTVMDEAAFIPLGALTPYTALRRNIRDRIPGNIVFWGLKRE